MGDVKRTDSGDLVETNIEELPPKQQRFIHLYVTGQYTLQKLSQLLEVHPNTLSNWLRRKDIKEMISQLQQDTHYTVGVQLKAMSNMAIDKLQKLIDSPIDGVALQAVKDVLDRSGHKPKQEIQVDKRVVTFEEKLSKLIDMIDDEDIIDVEAEVIEDEN